MRSPPRLVTCCRSPRLQTMALACLCFKHFCPLTGSLRWLGLSENGECVTLKWITEDDGIQISATISETALTIEAKFLQDRNLNVALKASHQLLAHISRLCSRSQLLRRVAYFGNSDVYL